MERITGSYIFGRIRLVGPGGRQVVTGDDSRAVFEFDLYNFIDDGRVDAELLQESFE